jgi:hypothetical protein
MKPFNWSERLPLAESKFAPETGVLAPASAVLQWLLGAAPADQFTLIWLLGHLHRRSFGFIMLLLALVAMLPGISYIAGLLLAVPALEMIAGRVAPVFPRRIATRPLPTRHLARVVRRWIWSPTASSALKHWSDGDIPLEGFYCLECSYLRRSGQASSHRSANGCWRKRATRLGAG